MSDRRGGYRDSRVPQRDGERNRDRDDRREPRDWRRDGGGRAEHRRSRSRSPRRDGRGGRGERDPRDRRDDSRRDARPRDRVEDRRDHRRDDRDRHGRDDDRRPPRRDGERDQRDDRKDEARLRKPEAEDSVAPTRNDTTSNGPLAERGEPSPVGEVDGEIEEGEDMEEDEAQMMAAMGFGGFDSTKGKAVIGNQQGAANIKKQRTWRQYMNRKGGFNRPLDKIK